MSGMKWLGTIYRKQGNAVFAKVSRRNFDNVMEKACRKTGGRISAISGRDNGKSIELVYTFTLSRHVLNIKVEISRKNPRIQSIHRLFPGAALYERENFEMLGIVFEGNPRLKGILLDRASPKTPLRKPDVLLKEALDAGGK